MEPLRRRLLPATARNLLREAGPPALYLVTAGGVALVATAVLTIARSSLPPVAAILVLFVVAFAIAGLVDLDGWQIRRAMAALAMDQRRRASRPLPRTQASASRWLETANGTSPVLEQATALMMADRLDEARELIDGFGAETAEDGARKARMLAGVEGMKTGEFEPKAALEAIAALPPADRRYHELALAWSQAWISRTYRRPWRPAFAETARRLAPYDVPGRYAAWIALQELSAAIAAAGAGVIGLLLGWF